MWSAGVGPEGGGDVPVALTTENREDQVAAGRHDLRSGTGADGGAIFIEGDIPHVMEPVLNAPMAADQGEQARGIRAFG